MALGEGEKAVEGFDVRGIRFFHNDLSYIGDGGGVGTGRHIIDVPHEETFQEEGDGAKKDVKFVGDVVGKQIFKVFFVHLDNLSIFDLMALNYHQDLKTL